MIKFIIYAPNVHVGGGKVLLEALLAAWPVGKPFRAYLDARSQGDYVLPNDADITWVRATISSRLSAERMLAGEAGVDHSVLCFHGQPPLIAKLPKVIVFLQNKLYIDVRLEGNYGFKVRLRLMVEKLWFRLLRNRVDSYLVQTPTMRAALKAWMIQVNGSKADVRILPFMDPIKTEAVVSDAKLNWDFIYVADGVAHKNHRRLLEAWSILAEQGLYPSLALTLSPRDIELKSDVEVYKVSGNVNIFDLGQQSREKIIKLYGQSSALIFPSTTESFGLPLIEAQCMGLPVLASEKDYVRDVCTPVETFDPSSATSIARAVKRFLGVETSPLHIRTPKAFWQEMLSVDGCSDTIR